MKSHFIHELELKPLADGRNYRLVHGIAFWTRRTGMITVPAHFETDLASVPQLFWNIFPPFGKYDDAAVVHDWLYRTQLVPRSVADATFFEGMRVKRVGFCTRWILWTAVRCFGWAAWRNDARHIKPHHHHSMHHIRH